MCLTIGRGGIEGKAASQPYLEIRPTEPGERDIPRMPRELGFYFIDQYIGLLQKNKTHDDLGDITCKIQHGLGCSASHRKQDKPYEIKS